MAEKRKAPKSQNTNDRGSAAQSGDAKGRPTAFKESQRLKPNRVAPKLVQKPPTAPKK